MATPDELSLALSDEELSRIVVELNRLGDDLADVPAPYRAAALDPYDAETLMTFVVVGSIHAATRRAGIRQAIRNRLRPIRPDSPAITVAVAAATELLNRSEINEGRDIQ